MVTLCSGNLWLGQVSVTVLLGKSVMPVIILILVMIDLFLLFIFNSISDKIRIILLYITFKNGK